MRIELPIWRHPDPSPATLRRLYVSQRRTEREIAQLLGISRAHVADALVRAGIERRSSRKPCPVDDQTLGQLYQVPDATPAGLARRFGVASATVLRWLADAGLLDPDPAVDHGRLRELYLDKRLTVAEVARKLRVSRPRVQRELVVAGIGPRSSSLRRPRDNRATLTDARLRRYYEKEHRGVVEIAALVGVSTEYVSKRLRAMNLVKRPGGFHPKGPMPAEELQKRAVELYESGMNMHAVGKELGVSGTTVRRALHDAQAPVRRSGPKCHEEPARVLIDDLYADNDVRAVLGRHGIAIPRHWTPTGPFETLAPLPLSPSLLKDLYDKIGLAILHIALVLGVGTEAVRRGLLGAGVVLREPGEPAPWTARRTQQ